MNHMTRRHFLGQSAVATAGIYGGLIASGRAGAMGANNEIRVAVAGINSQGNGHIGRFQSQEGVQVVALCDPDSQVLAKRAKEFETKYGMPVQGYADVRDVLDRKDIDVLVVATPNHWHSLMTILACQAGKDVYVEKPVSHCIWEGRKMVEAARKYNRVVQAGTQQRSCPAMIEAAQDIQAGKYGKVQWIHCSKLGSRQPIGKVTSPQPVPANIDYNLWAGPAPMSPVMRQQFHYDWHWQWSWGDGEMANWGIHYLDDVRHLLGTHSVPTKIQAAGNRFAWNDNGETPNMHLALATLDEIPVVIDVRNLPDPLRKGGNSGAVYLKSRGSNYIQCEGASLRLSRGGGGAYDRDNKRIHKYTGDGGASHTANFIEAVRTRRTQDLAAEIEVGHLSTVICHQANIAWRVGQTAAVDQVRQAMKSHPDALHTLTDMLEQLSGNNVDLAQSPFVLGPELTYDPLKEQFTGSNAAEANALLRCDYRAPFVIGDTA
jgi:predicted dehydrogenase